MSYGNRTLPDSRESGDEATARCHYAVYEISLALATTGNFLFTFSTEKENCIRGYI